jgi:uncharacterized protein YprB with RNaseH-like and TPR domain
VTAGDLAAGLRRLARERAARDRPRFDAMHRPEPPRAPLRVDGGEIRPVDGRAVYIVRRDAADLQPGRDLAGDLGRALESLSARDPEDVDRGLRAAAGFAPRDLAVMDLETTGFWGCPIFLVGLLLEEDGRWVTHQLLARDYPEEAGILRLAAELLRDKRLLVTFNGKSYDLPCLRERAAYHRVPARLDELAHVDLLHPARRRFRTELPDCRLQTLEREVVGIFRAADVPSRDIPAVYHAFAATGEARLLAPVLHHSRVDLLTTARLFAELAV